MTFSVTMSGISMSRIIFIAPFWLILSTMRTSLMKHIAMPRRLSTNGNMLVALASAARAMTILKRFYSDLA
ncbi:hypothetical protein CWS02_13785 [Enterobacter sp. EA-1]|nr:hypothetical protein CWS02_13785 [Enterobacter sp. EA-1]